MNDYLETNSLSVEHQLIVKELFQYWNLNLKSDKYQSDLRKYGKNEKFYLQTVHKFNSNFFGNLSMRPELAFLSLFVYWQHKMVAICGVNCNIELSFS